MLEDCVVDMSTLLKLWKIIVAKDIHLNRIDLLLTI